MHNLTSILLLSPFLIILITDLLFWPLLSSELIIIPRAHSDGWKPIVPYVNTGLLSPCCLNCHKDTLFLSNFMRNLRCGSFCSKGWKSTVGENKRGILKGTRTEFKMVLYSVTYKGHHIIKTVLCIWFFFPSQNYELLLCIHDTKWCLWAAVSLLLHVCALNFMHC